MQGIFSTIKKEYFEARELYDDYKRTKKAIFDLYAGKGIEEGKKSLAFALTFGANDRTLTNQEINDVLEKIVDRLSKIGEIRQK